MRERQRADTDKHETRGEEERYGGGGEDRCKEKRKKKSKRCAENPSGKSSGHMK